MAESTVTTAYRNGEVADARSEQHVASLVQDLTDRCDALERERDELRAQLARLEPAPKKPRGVRSVFANLLFAVLAALVVAAAGVAIAIASGLWKLNPAPDEFAATATVTETTQTPTSTAQTAPTDTAAQTTAPGAAATPPTRGSNDEQGAAAAAPVLLVARASGGECWLQVRRGDASGKVIWEGILPKGDSVQFDGKQVWLRVGDPSVLKLVLNGEAVENLPTLAADLLVTPSGVRVVGQG